MRVLLLLVLAMSLVAAGCGGGASSTTPNPSPSLRTDTIGLADLYGLQLEGTHLSKEVILPRHFREHGWSLLQHACLVGLRVGTNQF